MDEYERDHQERVGERGNPVFRRTRETTDLDEMREKEVETTGTCYCGRPITDRAAVRRCVRCDLLCCGACEVVVRRRVVCQSCAARMYGLDKDVFLTLYVLDAGLAAPDDLVAVETLEDGTPVEVRVDPAADHLFGNGYVAEDGSLTPRGREALSVGQQLYGEDRDVKETIREARIRAVADR
ncbi:MAG: hypothetical protein SVU32_03715 [Candidatus Nanohaloarchaea archaeon]|nr:hypothetical protein [Candidatus Nanohaloarchaea archaeon]